MRFAIPYLFALSVLCGPSAAEELALPVFDTPRYCESVAIAARKVRDEGSFRSCLARESTAKEIVLSDWRRATTEVQTNCGRVMQLLDGGTYEGLRSCLAAKRDRKSRTQDASPTA